MFLIRVIGTKNNLHSWQFRPIRGQTRVLINQSEARLVAVLHQYELYQAYRVSRAKTNEGTLRLDIDIYFRTFDTQWSSKMFTAWCWMLKLETFVYFMDFCLLCATVKGRVPDKFMICSPLSKAGPGLGSFKIPSRSEGWWEQVLHFLLDN